MIDRTDLLRSARRGDRWQGLTREPLPDSAPATAADVAALVAGSLAARAGRGDSGHIDHSPGGSPNPLPPAAPAPMRTVALADRRTLRPSLRRLDGHLTAADVLSRAHAAARLVLRTSRYSPEDRADVAADIVAKVWTDHPDPRAATVPADRVTFTRLTYYAANLRRSLDRERDADRTDRAELAASGESGEFVAHVPAEAPDTRSTPEGSARFALDALAALGLPADGVYRTAAYMAARAAAGWDSATAARELGISPETLRQHVSRLPGRVPSAGDAYRPMGAHADDTPAAARDRIAAHAEALATGDHTRPARTRTPALATAPRGDGGQLPDPAPVTVRRMAGRTRSPWDGRRRASWTAGLDARTSARLAAAARMSRDRVNALDADTLADRRQRAGLPAAVR
jgi:hypothetical protein